MLTIRQKLTLWFTLMVALIIGLGAALGALGFRQLVSNLATYALIEREQEVQILLQTLIQDKPETETIQRLKQVLSHEPTLFYDHLYFQIKNHQGDIVIQSDEIKQMPDLDWEKTGRPQFQEVTLYLGPNHQAVPVLFTTSSVQVLPAQFWQVQLGLSLKNAQDFTQQLFLSEVIVFIFSVLLALGTGQWLAGKAMQPVQSIMQQVNLMSGEEMSLTPTSTRIETRDLPDDEIGTLAHTFNGLLQRIAQVFQVQKQFVADVSHEFHTPLTVIRGHAQLLSKRGRQYPETLEKSTQAIIRESDYLTELVDDLLLLNRLETQSEKKVSLDIVGLLQMLYEDLQPLYPRLHLNSQTPQFFITGNALALRRLFINLIENALKATEKAGEVTIQIRDMSDTIQVQIHDTGVGIAQEHLTQIFKRFYRIDHARNRETGGSGIGLALVKEVINYHAGQIAVESKLGQGSRFTVSLPKA